MNTDLDDLSDFLASDSSDDDDILEMIIGLATRNNNFLEETVPSYDERTFLSHFRVSRDIATKIAAKYSESSYYKEDKNGQFGRITAFNQVIIFLWFVGHQTSTFRKICDRFNISLSSLHRIIMKLSFFLSDFSAEMIKWPDEEGKSLSEVVFKSNGFPNTIGAIGTCHIAIDKPDTEPGSYVNRKGYYSVQLQAVCDHNCKIIDTFVGYPGSWITGEVFRDSPLYHSIRQKCGPYFLLGDGEYPLLKNVLTPLRDKGNLTRRQINYNVKLNGNRRVIDRCFAILKQKFRQLNRIKLKNISVVVHFIIACCVLYNMSLEEDFILKEKEQRQTETYSEDLQDEEAIDEIDAIAIRENIADLLD